MHEEKLQLELNYSSGKILSSMCADPYSFAKQIYRLYLDKNLGDPTLFPATAEKENETIQMLGSLLSNPRASGSIVSGGTEANILALWTAQNRAKKEGGEEVVPVSAHYSFHKEADLLNLKLVSVKKKTVFKLM